jgi:uncharacterized membrane protein YwaF
MMGMTSLMSRLFFLFAFVLLGIAVLEKLLNFAGYTFSWFHADPSRLLDFATILLIFVITILLREIRDGQGKH